MWTKTLIDQLLAERDQKGGWSYLSGQCAAAEPTAWVSLALSAHGVAFDDYRHGLDYLARIQRPTGGIPTQSNVESPCWTTGPAIIAWSKTCPKAPCSFDDAMHRGANWLLQQKGKPAPKDPTIYGHDTSLIAWSWVEGTHSWVEPTAYAVLALEAVGQGEHPRVVEGRRLLRDRMITGGGWNYGNAKMFGAALRPFPETTGVALLALSRSTLDERIESSLEYLLGELPRVRSPMAQAWGVMALTAWQRRPPDAAAWLAETAERVPLDVFDAHHAALLLLADLEPCPLVTMSLAMEPRHG